MRSRRGPRDFYTSTVIRLAYRKWEEAQRICRQNCVAGRETVETHPAVSYPDRARQHLIGDKGFRPQLSSLIVDSYLVSIGQMTCGSVGPRYPEFGHEVLCCEGRQRFPFIVERMIVC